MPAPDFSIRLGLVGHAQVIQGIESIINISGRLLTKIRELSKAGSDYRRVVEGHTVSLVAADRATDGLIDTMELHRGAAVLETANLRLTAEQMRAVAVAAVNLAQRTGGDATAAYRQLTEALLSGREQGLKRYGVELQGITGRTERVTAAVNQLTAQFGEQTRVAGDLADEAYRLENAWGTAWAEMLSAAERSSGPLREIMRGITGSVNELADALGAQRRAAEHMARLGRTQRVLDLQAQAESTGYDAQGNPIAGAAAAIRRAGRATGDALFGQAGEMDARQRAIALHQAVADEQAREIADIRNGQAVVGERPDRRVPTDRDNDRPAGGSAATRRRAAEAEAQRFLAESERILDEIEALEEEAASHRYIKRAEEAERLEEIMLGIVEANAHARIDAEIKADEEVLASRQRLAEQTEALAEKERESRARTIDKLTETGSALGALGSITQEIGGIMDSVAGENARSTKVMAGILGAFKIAENVVAAATEVAKAAASAADQQYGQAVLHGLAAALHIAAAAKAATELGTGGKSTSGASSGGGSRATAHYPERQQSYGRDRDPERPVVVNVTGPTTSRRVSDELDALARDSSRRAA